MIIVAMKIAWWRLAGDLSRRVALETPCGVSFLQSESEMVELGGIEPPSTNVRSVDLNH